MKKFIYIRALIITLFIFGFIVGGIIIYESMTIENAKKDNNLIMMPYIYNHSIDYQLNIRNLILTAKIATINRELETPLLKALDGITDLEEIEITIKIYEDNEIYNILKEISSREIIDLIK